MPPNPSPPIALATLSIRDFRGIDRLDLDFRGPDGLPNRLVVIAGPNGCGKTAVLESALIAVGAHHLAVGRIGKKAIRKGAEDYEIAGSFQYKFDQEPSELLTRTSRFASRTADRKSPFWYFSSWRTPTLVGAVDVTVGKPGRRPAKTDANRLLNVKQQLANAAAAENFRRSRRPLLLTYSRWIDRINEAWARFHPDSMGRFDVELVEPEEGESGSFEVYLGRPELPPLSVDDLSAGQLELFLFIAALVLNDDREGIIFIDEPELHLDPQWHSPILHTLMSLQPRAQFIVATHSPEIYDSATSYERHFLVPDNDPRARAWPLVPTGTLD